MLNACYTTVKRLLTNAKPFQGILERWNVTFLTAGDPATVAGNPAALEPCGISCFWLQEILDDCRQSWLQDYLR